VLGKVLSESRTIGSETRLLATRIENTDGTRLEVGYQDNSFEVAQARYYDASGVLIATLTKNSIEPYYQLKNEAPDFVFHPVVFLGQDFQALFVLLSAMPNYLSALLDYREKLISYLMTKYGFSKDAANSQIEFPQTIFNRSLSRKLPTGAVEVFRFNPFRVIAPGGTQLFFNASHQFISETFSDASRNQYFYRPDGTYYAYRTTDTSGETRGYRLDKRLVSENIDTTEIVYVGYPDKGFSNVGDAVLFARPGSEIRIAPGFIEKPKPPTNLLEKVFTAFLIYNPTVQGLKERKFRSQESYLSTQGENQDVSDLYRFWWKYEKKIEEKPPASSKNKPQINELNEIFIPNDKDLEQKDVTEGLIDKAEVTIAFPDQVPPNFSIQFENISLVDSTIPLPEQELRQMQEKVQRQEISEGLYLEVLEQMKKRLDQKVQAQKPALVKPSQTIPISQGENQIPTKG